MIKQISRCANPPVPHMPIQFLSSFLHISDSYSNFLHVFFQPLPYLSFTLQNAPINLPPLQCHPQKSTDLIHASLPHIWKLPSWNSVLNSLSWLISEFPGFFPKPSSLHYFSVSSAGSTASLWPENSVLFSFLLLLSSFFLSYMVFVNHICTNKTKFKFSV